MKKNSGGKAVKRTRNRVPFTTEIVVNHEGKALVYKRTHDISMNGVFVSTAKPLKMGVKGEFSIILSAGMRKEKINGMYEVVRIISVDDGLSDPKTGPGMGLKFTGLEPESSELLYNLIQHNQPDEDEE
ncbi:MAG: PilZ domain-containing protein [Nitrospinae bacterium]|nr:PilZ domain-containing protein [Nitrospinota bacterium]MBF0634055.1 PilZ domain-containing protein [Nitrospinota bacterium]